MRAIFFFAVVLFSIPYTRAESPNAVPCGRDDPFAMICARILSVKLFPHGMMGIKNLAPDTASRMRGCVAISESVHQREWEAEQYPKRSREWRACAMKAKVKLPKRGSLLDKAGVTVAELGAVNGCMGVLKSQEMDSCAKAGGWVDLPSDAPEAEKKRLAAVIRDCQEKSDGPRAPHPGAAIPEHLFCPKD